MHFVVYSICEIKIYDNNRTKVRRSEMKVCCCALYFMRSCIISLENRQPISHKLKLYTINHKAIPKMTKQRLIINKQQKRDKIEL